MTDRLSIYNSALIICAERTLASLTENREPRRNLDLVFDNGGIDACLEKGQWKFAMRAVRLDFDPAITPDFGYRRAFTIPTDWVLTSAVCSDEYFTAPLLGYSKEVSNWFADVDEIFVKYVSNDTAFGNDLSLWPATFTDYVAAHFAAKIIFKLTSDEKKRESVIKWEKRQLTTAKSKDAMSGPQQFPAPGVFVTSRYHLRSRRDRGSRGRLLG